MNFEVKGNLAKLLATENLTVQHNKVQTASFDVKNRILTLPVFKEKSGDVYDMLIAHECAHALFTPYEEWEGINDNELRGYVNVIEDCRIDKLIQAKYPGVVKNYMNGFDILENKNFFGLHGKDINKDLMLIDKVNLRSKSLNRLPLEFDDVAKEWLSKVDAVVTFEDVVNLAKEMIAWQKEQIEDMKQSIPNFDQLEIASNYDLVDEDDDEFETQDTDNSAEQESGQASGSATSDEDAESENEDSKAAGSQMDSDTSKLDNFENEGGTVIKGADGEVKLKVITDSQYEAKKEELLDGETKGFTYGNLPEVNFKGLVDFKEYISEFKKHIANHNKFNDGVERYNTWLDKTYKEFIKENKKTVMYLVKEFEMKKAATAYKRASTDKTGVIDPLKLPSYKFSDDIFKRLTIVPDGKNHGMIMLLDWSGSMSDSLMNTVEQLLNLVEFVRKVNIPFEVYFFTSERRGENEKPFNHKEGDFQFDNNLQLVNCFSHRMTKKEFEFASKMMYHMAWYFQSHYTYGGKRWNKDWEMARYSSYGIPSQFYLGNTPLNEALLVMKDIIPMFKSKYDIEKLTFITLTDGGANTFYGYTIQPEDAKGSSYGTIPVLTFDKKNKLAIGNGGYGRGTAEILTETFLNYFRKKYDANVIGFYILKRVKKWDIEQYMSGKDFFEREKKTTLARKEMTKNKAVAVNKPGYNKFFIMDGKKLNVENFDLNEVEIKKETVGEFKRAFGKSMSNRLVSRVVLNKFIAEVA